MFTTPVGMAYDGIVSCTKIHIPYPRTISFMRCLGFFKTSRVRKGPEAIRNPWDHKPLKQNRE